MKDERTKQFAYSFHAATDEHGFVLGTIVTPGNIHDSHMLQPLVDKVIEKVKKPLAVAANAAYKTPAIKVLRREDITSKMCNLKKEVTKRIEKQSLDPFLSTICSLNRAFCFTYVYKKKSVPVSELILCNFRCSPSVY